MQLKEFLKDKYILITGATDGIGKRLALRLAKSGYNLILHGKNPKKLEEVINSINQSHIKLHKLVADFSDLKETYDAFSKIVSFKIYALINNAATFSHKLTTTKDGFEITYQVNYLAHFLITHILLKNLINSEEAKIINVASMAHSNSINLTDLKKNNFPTGFEAYSLSKLCNILFTFKLHNYFMENDIKNVSANCLHPGVLNTKLLVNNWGPIGSDPENGAKMIEYVLNQPINVSGKYFSDFSESKASNIAYDKDIQNKLYNITCKQIEKAGLTIEKIQ
ncbi:SDR family NAD(P)-dependent oxidoreductase [Deferribacter thermophilus]|uniref:SDR family NAD(P)-dependent oxidoreductase n=1 Tax=Deferribacter thermophilus TaxID=53573 RepID=UPI003C13D93C